MILRAHCVVCNVVLGTITAAKRLDGVYVIETTLGAEELDSIEIQTSYKMLSIVERAFRITKGELEIRPVFHYKKPGQSQLKPKFSGFTPEIAVRLNLWQITLPT